MAKKHKTSELRALAECEFCYFTLYSLMKSPDRVTAADSSENHQTPLSAFAVAKARLHQPQASQNDPGYQNALEYNSRSAHIFSSSGTVPFAADPSNVALESRSALLAPNTESDIEYDTDVDGAPSEGNGLPPNERPADQSWALCTWTPMTTNIKSEFTEHITILLKQAETVTFVGTYEIAVLKGVVTINGAILRSHPTFPINYRVFAPSTHAVPVVQCISSSGSEVQFFSCDYTMRSMQKLSPLYSRIWNVRKKYENGQLGKEVRSFSLVGNSGTLQTLFIVANLITSDDTNRGGSPEETACSCSHLAILASFDEHNLLIRSPSSCYDLWPKLLGQVNVCQISRQPISD